MLRVILLLWSAIFVIWAIAAFSASDHRICPVGMKIAARVVGGGVFLVAAAPGNGGLSPGFLAGGGCLPPTSVLSFSLWARFWRGSLPKKREMWSPQTTISDAETPPPFFLLSILSISCHLFTPATPREGMPVSSYFLAKKEGFSPTARSEGADSGGLVTCFFD